MYNCSVITNVNLFFKWLKLLQVVLSKKDLKHQDPVFMLKLKLLAIKILKIIKRNIEDRVDKMAQSAKKRTVGKKPLSKKTQVKFGKRLKANYIVLNKLTN